MEYVYAALLLHKAGKEITEENVKKVIEAAGIKADEARIKALITALEGVDIEEAINKATMIPTTTPTTTTSNEQQTETKQEPEEEEEEVSTEKAAEGLGALFG